MTSSVSSYEQAIDFLFQRINYERASVGSYSSDDLKLDRMRSLLARIGNPQDSLPAIHLAGTKGKGSTATMLASVLEQAGYRVGLFTSPHLHVFEERIVVNRQMPSQAGLVQLLNELLPVLNEMDQEPGEMAPTYFEIATALTWIYFQQQETDIVVLETGLGGRLDTTKLCQPVLTLITSIGLDHTNLLGETYEEIAVEKAGIIKAGVPVISGVLEPGAQQVVESVAQKLDAPFSQLDRDFEILNSNISWNQQTGFESQVQVEALSGKKIDLQLNLPGEHQGYNASLVVVASEILQKLNWNIPETALQTGIAKTECPLRTEVVQTQPTIILDAAHNVASVSALLKTLSVIPTKKSTVLFAAARDKDAVGMLKLLHPIFDRVILTEFQSNPRALPLPELIELAEKAGLGSYETATDSQSAYQQLMKTTEPDELICVTGSFFLAVEMRRFYMAEEKRTN